jgi:hypothetical protein
VQGESTTRALWGGDRFDRLLACAVPLGLMLFAFRGPLAGRLFYLRDISQNHHPLRRLVTDRLMSGELPLWDPYHGAGTPLLANPNNLVLHPMSALFALFPLDVAFTLSILLQFILLAWGGYLLARALPVGRPAASLAAVILTLSGPAASMASQQNVLSAAAWVPLGLWAWLSGLQAGGRWRLGLAAGCAAVILGTGEAASVMAFIGLALILAMTRAIPRGERTRHDRVALTFSLLLVGALALAAAQILPARELLALSTRGAGFSAAEGLKWSLQPLRLLETVVPQLFGNPVRLSPSAWWGRWLFEGGYPFLLSIYLGATPCLLAIAACWRGGPGGTRRRSVGAAAAVFVLAAIGAHGLLYRALFEWVPVVRQIRYPERFLLAALPAVALLAAYGLDDLLSADRRSNRWSILVAVAGAAAFLAVTLIAASPDLVDRFLAGAVGVPAAILAADTGAVLRGALLRSHLWLLAEIVALALLTVILWSARNRDRVAAWLLVGAVGVSTSLAAAPALSTADPGWLDAPSPLREAVAGTGRVHHARRPPDLAVWAKTDEVIWGYRYDRFTYALASGRRDGVPTVLDGATDRMDLSGSARLGREVGSMSIDERLRILSLCHTRFLFTYEALSHEALEPGPVLEGLSRPPLRVYRLRSTLSRARFVSEARRPVAADDPGRSLLDPGFDPERMVLIDGVEEPPAAGVGAGTAGGSAAIVEDSPERLRVQVDAPREGYLVLADAFAPGWRAEVDGVPTAILRANGLFRAVRVPAGRHLVEMTYLPRSVVLGFAISALAALLGVTWMVWSKRRST